MVTGREASLLHSHAKRGNEFNAQAHDWSRDAKRPSCIPTQSVGTRLTSLTKLKRGSEINEINEIKAWERD
ncbi:hypothetical protein [Desulfonema magnum]|uniref:hypothetical protein n=1 Tax=Desulfonema magnum TaxID=45655 RepID=UPI001A9BA8F4|nr:hypothetical protein [Desulfonema magnum]